jgi:hypothetical protein
MSDVPARWLRETLRGRTTTGSSSGCIDTDTLSAWSDGTLSAGERVAVESHASDCMRCQALVAAMARTTTPAPAREPRRVSRLGWLAALAGAAAAVVLWINISRTAQREQSATPPTSAAAASETSLPVASPPNASATPRGRSTASADRPAESRDADVKPRQPRANEGRKADASGAALGAARRLARKDAAPNGERDATAPPSAAAPAPGVDASSEIAARGAEAGATRDTPAATAPTPRAPARTVEVARSVARAEALSTKVVAPTQIVSPNPNVRWRLSMGGGVERSIDGGTTWQKQSIGVQVMWTAGAAPAETICWIVGPGGMVVLSIDGRTWQLIPIPEAIDLKFISASDATRATVMAADGRTFTTIDGGKTWQPR